MQPATTNRGKALNAILIAPHRELAEQFARAVSGLDAFQILLDLKSYPSEQTLDIRVRQLQPEVLLLDIASNLELATGIITYLVSNHPGVTVIALDLKSGSETILRVLRAGASEFLYSPFAVSNRGG